MAGDPSFPAVKRCPAKGHVGNRVLPLTEDYWYFRKSGRQAGQPTSQCKDCWQRGKLKRQRGASGYVPIVKVRPLLNELVERCGTMRAAAELSGIAETVFRKALGDFPQKRIQRHTVRLLVLALHERRREDRRNGASERFIQARRKQAEIEEKMQRFAGY